MKRSWSDRLRRMVAPHDRIEAENLAKRAAREGCTAIGDAKPRERVRLLGTVESITTDARGWPRVQLADPTGTVTLVWMGKQRLAAITEQSHLIATGRLAVEDGRLVIYNPDYEVID